VAAVAQADFFAKVICCFDFLFLPHLFLQLLFFLCIAGGVSTPGGGCSLMITGGNVCGT